MKTQNSPRQNALSRPQFAKDLRTFRLSLDLTQNEIAKRVGINPHTYISYERGYCQPPADVICRIAESFRYKAVLVGIKSEMHIVFEKMS